MNSIIAEYNSSMRASTHKATVRAAVKVAKEICRLFPYIKQVQPEITGIFTGMGSWSFNGHGIAVCKEQGHVGELIRIDGVSFSDIVMNENYDYDDEYTSITINKELKQIGELVLALVDCNELNCSTWQDGFNEQGILFVHSETDNQSNPFATPNKAYHMDNDYYRGLVKAKVPIVFEHAKSR